MSEQLQRLIDECKASNSWIKELEKLAAVINELNIQKTKWSVRSLAKLVGKSKSWIFMSLELMNGIAEYPHIIKIESRYAAYKQYNDSKKLQRFMKK